MKPTICSVLYGLSLAVFIVPRTGAIDIDSITQNELNKRLNVKGAMGGNITLTSNSSLGSGEYSFVVPGETNDRTPVVIKITSTEESESAESWAQEYYCYNEMNATTDKVVEKYGIPFIYHSGDFLEYKKYKLIAMTKLDKTLWSLREELGLLSRDSVLIFFRDMIKVLKFVHSKGIIHADVKGDNIMTKGANVFLIDFNVCMDKDEPTEDILTQNGDMMFLYIHMYDLTDNLGNATKLSDDNIEIDEEKQKTKPNNKISSQIGTIRKPSSVSGSKLDSKNCVQQSSNVIKQSNDYSDLVKPFNEYIDEVDAAMKEKRLLKYDYFYKMFDDVLYTGRNRSERIVFEWLTPEEKEAAMKETILPIESIVFPKTDAN